MLLLENQPPPLTPQEGVEAEEAMIWSRRRIVCRRCSVQEELLLLLLPRGAAAAAYNRLWTRAEIKVGYSRQEAEDDDAIYRHREREREIFQRNCTGRRRRRTIIIISSTIAQCCCCCG